MKEHQITVGVPQGSVLGPFMWNVMYDGILKMQLQNGAKLIGYADDIALVITQSSAELLQIIANDSLRRCNIWLERNGLELAVSKTEAILVTNIRKFMRPTLRLQNFEIEFKRDLCYLGVQLDSKLSFNQHIINMRNKALRTATSLARIMPNTGGPKPHIRRLISSVVHSQLLYAAPTFAAVMNTKKRTNEIQKPQRICALRVISAYRTVSTAAALVLASIPPIDLLVSEKEEIYYNIRQLANYHNVIERKNKISEIRETARQSLLSKWQDRWQHEERGRWTHHLIPNIKEWIERRHGNMSYYLAQAMTSHGNFNQYLYRFKIKNTPMCDICETMEETARHMLFDCKRWISQRQQLNSLVHDTVTSDNLIEIMLTSKEAWIYCEQYITSILKMKSTALPNLL